METISSDHFRRYSVAFIADLEQLFAHLVDISLALTVIKHLFWSRYKFNLTMLLNILGRRRSKFCDREKPQKCKKECSPCTEDHVSWKPLREKCPNTELFLVRIFLHSDWIRRNTVSLRIQSEYRKIRTRNNSVFGHFHAVHK